MWKRAVERPPQPAVSRILSPPSPLRATEGDDHSSSPAITGGIKQPTRKLWTGRPLRPPGATIDAGTPHAPLFGLAPCGVLPATRVATSAVRSYRTFSPLPASALSGFGAAGLATCRWLCIFCATFLQVALTGRYPAHCPSEFGLSSRRSAVRREGGRSSGLLRRCYLFFLPRPHRSPAKCRIAPASCTDCCAACR
jgi:hypothetical protein